MATRSISATANGASAGIYLQPGEHLLRVRKSVAWGAGETAALEFSPTDADGEYEPYKDSAGAVSFTANGSRIVPAGLFYRIVVSSYAGNPITVSPHHITPAQ